MVTLRLRIKLSLSLSVFLAFSLIIVIFHFSLFFFCQKTVDKLQEKAASETASLIKAAKGRNLKQS